MKQLISVSPQQMQEVDDLMVKKYGITILQMMEHDARALTEVGKIMFRGTLTKKRVLVVAGHGGNGAGGMAAARYLHNAGAEVEVLLAGAEKKLSKEGKQHLKTLKSINIIIHNLRSSGITLQGAQSPTPRLKSRAHLMLSRGHSRTLLEFDLVVDALLGYSAEGDPRPPYDELILLMNEVQRRGARVLANDIPSGLDVISGLPHKPCVKADVTLTLGLPKTGLLEPAARDWIGELYLADIGIPPEIYDKVGIEVPKGLFEREWIIKLT